MESITVPTESPTAGPLAEIKQISVVDDEDVGAVNALLADGWKLVHNQGFKYWSQRRYEKR
jgi:hypothetical protein